MSHRRFIGLLLALVTLVIYLPVSHQGFSVYDDGDYVSQNRIVQAGLTWAGVKWAFTSWFASNWHPLTWLSHLLDCELFGPNPGAQHLVNVLFHAANAVLLFALLLRMTGATWAAAMVAALFAWHPLRVESVAWVAERKDVLSTFFELWSLWCYTGYVREKHRRDFYLALLFFVLGLLAKPMVVTLPFLLLLLDWWPFQRFGNSTEFMKNAGKLALEKWPFFLFAFGSCVVTFLAQHALAVVSIEQYPVPLRLENALLSYAKYLWKTVWPVNLAVIYPLPNDLPWLQVAAVGGGLIVVCFLVWRERLKYPYLLVGWCWFLGTLVPVIGVVQVGKQAMADRYSYFPVIGIVIAVVFLIKDLAARFQWKPMPLAAIGALILAANVVATENQLSYWKDDVALFSHALAVTQDNATAQINLGTALEQQGKQAEALAHYKTALKIDPNSTEAHNNLANLLDEAGQTKDALENYQAALRLNPNAPLAHCNLGTLLVKLGRFDEAMREYEAAARLQPENLHVYYLMGKANLRQGQSTEAIAQLRHALDLDGNDYQSLAFLARILATDTDSKNRDGSTAVALAEKANMLSGGEQPFILDILGMAYAEAGHYDKAQETAGKALELANTAQLPQMAADIQRHLQSYQAGQPCRDTFSGAFKEKL